MTLPSRAPIIQLASGSCGDPPDDAQDLKAIAPFIVKHVPLLRMLEADHRRENRVVAEEHPEARILNAQIAKLTSSVYSGEITLDANRYRSAHPVVKARIAAARAAAEDQRAEAMRRHIANVKQAAFIRFVHSIISLRAGRAQQVFKSLRAYSAAAWPT